MCPWKIQQLAFEAAEAGDHSGQRWHHEGGLEGYLEYCKAWILKVTQFTKVNPEKNNSESEELLTLEDILERFVNNLPGNYDNYLNVKRGRNLLLHQSFYINWTRAFWQIEVPSPPDLRRQNRTQHKNQRKRKREKSVTDKLIPAVQDYDINQEKLNDLVLQLGDLWFTWF